MSYLVLARKWRPQTFDQVVGQAQVTQTLKNAIELDRVATPFYSRAVGGLERPHAPGFSLKPLTAMKDQRLNHVVSVQPVSRSQQVGL